MHAGALLQSDGQGASLANITEDETGRLAKPLQPSLLVSFVKVGLTLHQTNSREKLHVCLLGIKEDN